MKILGIDEAGKGPVIGPLIICGFLMDEEKLDELVKLRVRDSKLVSQRRREFLAEKLKDIGKEKLVELSAMEIDKLRDESNLNKIEMKHVAEIINEIEPDKVIIDAFEANTKKFKEKLLAEIKKDLREKLKENDNLICENKADANYPVVGAASIIAKVKREEEISKLKEKFGDLGSGYPSDPKTIAFLKQWIKEKKKLPYFVRWSWVTAKELKKEAKQFSLKEF